MSSYITPIPRVWCESQKGKLCLIDREMIYNDPGCIYLYPGLIARDLPNKKNLKEILRYMDSNFSYAESLLMKLSVRRVHEEANI
jgi:hypothetical protein